MRFQFFGSQQHFLDHLRPLWDALPDEEVEPFPVIGGRSRSVRQNSSGPPRTFRIEAITPRPESKRRTGERVVAVVAAAGDIKNTRGLPYVLFEHGAGFSFHGGPRPYSGASYAGGVGKAGAASLPSTNRWVQERNLKAYPDTPAPIVGCPKLDAFASMPPPPAEPYTIAIGFHWDCKVAPEAGSALPFYRRVLPGLVRAARSAGFRLIGTGHPRARQTLWPEWRHLGVEVVENWADVCRQAHLYACDASSTLYEFARLGRPVVVLNAPWFRREVNHGLRFWECSDVGLNVNERGDLWPTIRAAAEDPPAIAARRAEVVDQVYPFFGRSTELAVAELRRVGELVDLGLWSPPPPAKRPSTWPLPRSAR